MSYPPAISVAGFMGAFPSQAVVPVEYLVNDDPKVRREIAAMVAASRPPLSLRPPFTSPTGYVFTKVPRGR